MNQEAWDTLNTKIGERDELQRSIDDQQQHLQQVQFEIQKLAHALEQDLAQLRPPHQEVTQTE